MAAMLLATVVWLPTWVEASGVEACGANPDSTQTTSGGTPDIEPFFPRRTGQKGVDLTARDIEHLWDSMYGLGLSDSVRQTLDLFTGALLQLNGSPVATDARNLQVIYDYFRLQGADWNPTDPQDSTAVRIGYGGTITGGSNFTNEDRSHADGYLVHPSRTGTGGTYPSDFTTLNEDSTSGRGIGDVRPANSLQVTGPPAASPIDMTGSGWTKPQGLLRLNWNHELQHSLPGVSQSGSYSELWSAGAEVVGGVFDTTATSEVPYTWPLLANDLNVLRDSLGQRIDCGATGWTNRWSRSNYQGRTSFMAYLAYNFLNADTARTLVGMRDDLMLRWRKGPSPGDLDGLGAVLSDDSCVTCRSKEYFRTATGPLTSSARIGVLMHNWRAATFVNNPALADSQFGYPAWSGFSPGRSQRAWQVFDGCDADDIVAIPGVIELGAEQIGRDTSLIGERNFRGATMPLALAPYAANYWVVRPNSALLGSSRTLVIRITPTACYSCDRFLNNDKDARLFVNAVAYDRLDGGGELTDLWKYPASAVLATGVDSMTTDSVQTRVVVVTIPEFGTTHKAVLLTLSLADGRTMSLDQGVFGTVYKELVPYRMDLQVLPQGVSSQAPSAISAVAGAPDLQPAWSWDGLELAYSAVDATVSPLPKIYRRQLGATTHSLVASGQTNVSQFAPDWSPRRDLLAFEGMIGGESGLWLKSTVSNASAYSVAVPSGRSSMPAFQPDGQGLAYVHIPSGQSVAYLRWVGIDGTGGRLIDTLGTIAGALPKPRWSPDGLRILIPVPEKGDLVHWAWRWGTELAPEASLSVPTRSLDIAPGFGRVLISSPLPMENRGAEEGGPFFGCRSTDPAERLALLDTTTAARDTFFRSQDLRFAQRHVAWSKNGQRYAFEQHHGVSGEADLWSERFSYDHAPALQAIADQSGETDQSLSFALVATDADDEPVSFTRSILPVGSVINNGTFIWSDPIAGIHFAIFRATDASGDVDTRVVKLTIQQSVPPCEPFCGGGGEHDPLGRRGGAGALTRLPSQVDATERNTFLDGALAGTLSRQVASLPDLNLDATGEHYPVRLTTTAGGGAFIDAMRLHVVDHDESVRVLSGSEGLFAGAAEEPAEVFDHAGARLGEILTSGEGLLVAEGQVLEFRWPANTDARGFSIDCERAVSGTGDGLVVQIREGDAWRMVGRVHPRRQRDAFGVPVIGADRIRLVAEQTLRLRAIERIIPDATLDTISSHVQLATHADGLDSVVGLGIEDGAGLQLTSDSPAGVSFPAPPQVEGKQRSFFLEVAGRYSITTASSLSRQGVEQQPDLPREFALGPALPNPTSGRVTFAVDVPRPSLIRLEVLDAQGRIIRTVVREERAAGRYRFHWDGIGADGRRVASGLYYARLRASEFSATRSVVLIP